MLDAVTFVDMHWPATGIHHGTPSDDDLSCNG